MDKSNLGVSIVLAFATGACLAIVLTQISRTQTEKEACSKDGGVLMRKAGETGFHCVNTSGILWSRN
jgi:hypothetical protein